MEILGLVKLERICRALFWLKVKQIANVQELTS